MGTVFYIPAGNPTKAVDHDLIEHYLAKYNRHGEAIIQSTMKALTDTFTKANRFEYIDRDENHKIKSVSVIVIDINSSNIPGTCRSIFQDAYDPADAQLAQDYLAGLRKGDGIWSGPMYLINKQLAGDYP